MELLQLKYFKDAAKYENFSTAAKKNFVPQPSISKAVKTLEEELGVPLFERVGKKIFLNDNGHYLYDNAAKIFNILDDCTEHFSHYRSSIINVYIQEGSFFIPMLTADFTLKHNNTTINYSTVSEVLHTKKSPFDFTFMAMQQDMSKYDYELLLEDDIVLLVSDQHPLADKDMVKLADLKEENFITYYNTISHRILSDRLCQQVGHFQPHYIYETHDEYIVLHLVSKNMGVTLIPEHFYNNRPYNNIKAIRLDKTIPCQLVIAWEKNKVLTSMEKTFLDFAKEWFRSNYEAETSPLSSQNILYT